MINIPTAKAFTNYIKLGEPYSRNGKKYIKVQKNAENPIKEVRWYTDKEYYKKYAETPKEEPFLIEFFIEKGTKDKEKALNWLWTIPYTPAPPLHWYLPSGVPLWLESPPGVVKRRRRLNVNSNTEAEKPFDLYEELEADPEEEAAIAEIIKKNKESDT